MENDFPFMVEYPGDNSILTVSPVFDLYVMPIEVPGKLVGQPAMGLMTFFLVYRNGGRKRLWWVNLENCNIVMLNL
jgi:hypothetical protein